MPSIWEIAFFENTYSEYPVVYAVTLSVFRGLIGVLVMTMGFFLAMYCENIFVVLTGPFLYTILENFVLAILGVPQYRLVTAFDPNCLSPEVITTMSFVARPFLIGCRYHTAGNLLFQGKKGKGGQGMIPLIRKNIRLLGIGKTCSCLLAAFSSLSVHGAVRY